MTCNSMLDTSLCAFSISSNNTTACGFFSTSLMNIPPPMLESSYPTYPGGDPISFAIECFSWYSDMSNLISSTPSVFANCLAVSVLPQPVGPRNRNDPTGFVRLFKPALATSILSVIVLIALSCPNTCSFIFSSSVFKLLACFIVLFYTFKYLYCCFFCRFPYLQSLESSHQCSVLLKILSIFLPGS